MAEKKMKAHAMSEEPEGANVDRMSRHVIGISSAIRIRTSEGLVARGHDLRASTAQVIPNLPVEGLRISELAARLRLTLQRTGQLVTELEEITSDITSSFSEILGDERFGELCDALTELDVALHGANAPVRVVSRELRKE